MMQTVIEESNKFGPTLTMVGEKVEEIRDNNQLEFNMLESKLKAGIHMRLEKVMENRNSTTA